MLYFYLFLAWKLLVLVYLFIYLDTYYSMTTILSCDRKFSQHL
jgi:hypothetical protein